MKSLSTFLLLGTQAIRTARCHPAADLWKRDVDVWVATEQPIALEQLLCNIGPGGCHSAGVSSGLVIASPSTQNPDYFYHWTRDAALVFKCIVDLFVENYNTGLQKNIQDYIVGQAKLQTVSNPSGNFADGSGLGEPKFLVNMAPFTGGWGRPQRDGPALRAIAMIGYAKWLVNNGYGSTANTLVWPVIKNDLAYVAQYWNQTGFDLWEEVQGSSFFTIASQHRSLVEGSSLAKLLGTTCTACDAIAPQILCFQQRFWSASQGYIVSNINGGGNRNGKDANSILTAIHNFDATLTCDAVTFQPCSDKALSNHKVVVDSFRYIYTINSGIAAGHAVAVGRYQEDSYYNGNPWYLNTLAAAEQLYDALYVWKSQGAVTVTSTSLAFFRDLLPSVNAGTYAAGSATYDSIISFVTAYADGFLNVAATYAQANGSMAEQYDRNNGQPLSARDLTWSYAAFLSAAQRRRAVVPGSWAVASAISVPGTCSATSVQGSYTSATATSFPPSQTPITGGPTNTISSTTVTGTTNSATSTTSTGCAAATSVAVTFNELVITQYGQTIKIVGSISELGNWDTTKAVSFSADQYTSTNPLWRATITLKAGQVIEYKYINVANNGAVTWERDPNHTYTVPASCSTAVTRSDTWQS